MVDEKMEQKTEVKEEMKKEKKKKQEVEAPKRTEAIVNGLGLPISTKHSIALCNFVRGKTIDKAISMLGEVLKMKRAVPMKGELPHRKGEGMERGRYPLNATKEFIKIIKQLAANAVVNGIELEKVKIECKANRASRPYKKGGSEKGKRTNVFLRLKLNEKNIKKN